MKFFLSSLFSILFLMSTHAQIVSLTPATGNPDEEVTLIFDASEGNAELIDASKIYMHHGVVLSSPTGTEWNYVQGNWGQDDGVGEMTSLGNNQWSITFSPTIREYFGASTAENLFRISCVFRSADGNSKGTIEPGDYGWGTVLSNLDFYVNLDSENYVGFNSPQGNETYISGGESISVQAAASTDVTEMTLFAKEDGEYVAFATVAAGKTISADYFAIETGILELKVSATVNGEVLEAEITHNVIVIQDSEIAELPTGMRAGINYDPSDDTKLTLVLEAPGKEYVHVVGDFSDWQVLATNQMKRTPDNQYFWLEITGLEAMKPYVFQYWVEDDVKIGDPYAEQAADPWNDQYIPESVFPNVPEYTKTSFHFATVFQTGQSEYNWSDTEDSWERPDVNNIVIYELLVRDFLATHSYDDLIDTLDYLQRLGVDAIELMPVNEFEGNESWGYNPAYFFAPDKYYGTKDDLKRFIESAHERGLAVIMDIVLNHAFGQNPMVKLYFDDAVGKPALDNPWFNRDHVGQYQWGYDFNHESEMTQNFIDRVNKHWIEEYHMDGYRFDFTKGFTNYAPGGSVDGFDQSRIDLLKRMADEIWTVDDEAYIILEHWAPSNEEQILGEYGMKMWRNRSYDYVPAMTGNISGNFNSMDVTTHVSFFNSHDERRIAEHAISEGANKDGYNVRQLEVMYERQKMTAAFNYLYPGPKMIWQFDELAYDIHIDFNGRVGNKPLPWGPGSLEYYEDPLRQHVYSAYREILALRKLFGPETLANANKSHKQNSATRRLRYDMADNDLVVIGNFGLTAETISGSWPQNGFWFDYFSGDSISIASSNDLVELEPGEWHIYTSEKISDGFPGVVEVFRNPVTIDPNPFTKSDEITIIFDASKASTVGTAGLIGADKVYMHSGVVTENIESILLENEVGNFMDDGIGEMTYIGEEKWSITITPSDYYSLVDEDIYRLGMYFHDENNVNQGRGFRDAVIYFNVDSDKPFITVEPAAFEIDDEITLTFNARKGNGELIDEDKIYMHSGVNLNETETPWIGGWNNVVGNWGADDGVGEMNEISGQDDIWEISFVPEDYYNLGPDEQLKWICAVFRSADGNTKGTGNPGPILNGLIHTTQDFFVRNLFSVNAKDTEPKATTYLYPNPTTEDIFLELEGFYGDTKISIFNITGALLKQQDLRITTNSKLIERVNLQDIPSGLFVIKIQSGNSSVVREFVKL